MKVLRNILFYLVCATVFLVATVGSSAFRAKYTLVPKLKSTDAYMYATNLDRYSFLQYDQAGPDQGRRALLEYLKLLDRIRGEKIEYSQVTLHRDFGLTYLRLYRLELADGNPSAAGNYMKSAQKEWSALGWKDVSAETLTAYVETLESKEQKLYNTAGIQAPAGQEKQDKPRGASK